MSGGTLHRLFEDRVRAAEDRTAVITDRGRLSYAQLDARANRLARYLTDTVRLPAGSTVAIRTVWTPDVLVAILGVLKAGGSYAVAGPGAPDHPALRKAAAVITHEYYLARVDDGLERPVICLERDAEAIDAHSGDPLDGSAVAGTAAAAVLFTAGTTGERRALPASHERLCAAYDAWHAVYRLTADDRVLVTAAPDSTEFTAAWIRTLCSGATLLLSREEEYTVADTDPETAASLLDDGDVSGLRLLAVGGERLRLDRQVRMQGRLAPGARLISVYGPTEVAGCGTWFEPAQLPGPVPDPERHAYLGQPFPGCAAEVRKGQIWLTPPGGGDAVPTGDLGLRDGEGPLEFRGRMADRVRIGGRTVDTYRVETALAEHPGIRESMVVEDGGRLIAYVLPVAGSAPGWSAVRSHLTSVVPASDIPRTVVHIRSLPRNGAGRVDRTALVRPASRGGPAVSKGASSAPETPEGRGIIRAMIVMLPVLILSLVLTDTFWPGSTDLSIVPNPWAWYFRGLYLAESLAFTAGVCFLIAGRKLMLRSGRSHGLTTAAHLAIVYLLASWWPQDNLYRLAAKQDWEAQAALVYLFNVPLMIAAGVVAVWAARGGLTAAREERDRGLPR